MLLEISASPVFQMLQVALDGTSMRQQAIANNIANSNTENYQALRVSFEEQLQQEILSSGSSMKSDIADRIKPTIETDIDTSAGISVDQEMVKLTKNFIHYQALLKALNGRLELTNLALNDGRR